MQASMRTDLVARAAADRRRFLAAAAPAAGLALAACAAHGRKREEGESGEAEVTPGEDLMQEHGVLERVLLIYGEVARRLEHGEQFDPTVVKSAAGIVAH